MPGIGLSQFAHIWSAPTGEGAPPLIPHEQSASVPLGLDNGHLVARAIPVDVIGAATYSMTSAYARVLPSGHIQITDKVAFYAALPAIFSIGITGAGGPEIIQLTCNAAPGYYDVELLKANTSVSWNTTSNLGRATDDDSNYIYDIEDHGQLGLHLHNPWFADRRPTLETSLINPALKAMRSVPPASNGSTYGIFMAQKGTDILNSKWHGLRYLRFNGVDTQLQVTRDLEPQNTPAKLTFPAGLLVGQPIILTVAWNNESHLVTRVNGIERERRTPATYITGSGGVTITVASPAVFTRTNHGFTAGKKVTFTTTGTLPSGLAVGATYYVLAAGLTASTFRVSATDGGPAINTGGSQSGTHTVSLVWKPPANPGILAFVGYALTSNLNRNATIISHTAGGQHPWWEGAGWDGEFGRLIEFLKVTGHL